MKVRTWIIGAAAIGLSLALGALCVVLQVWAAHAKIDALSQVKYSPGPSAADLPIEIVGRRFERKRPDCDRQTSEGGGQQFPHFLLGAPLRETASESGRFFSWTSVAPPRYKYACGIRQDRCNGCLGYHASFCWPPNYLPPTASSL